METLEQVQTFDLEAAHQQAELLLAHGTAEAMDALSNDLLVNSGNILFAREDFEGVDPANMAEAKLRLALDVATVAQDYPELTPTATPDSLKSVYVQLFDDAGKYQPGVEGYNPAVAKAKQTLAVSVWNRINNPIAAAPVN